jgi:uncharacterized protein YsxB (DUF464 family)
MRIHIVVSPDGALRGFDAEGHAGTDVAGANVACAAATGLLRTTARLCAGRDLVAGGGAKAPGHMSLAVAVAPAADKAWLAGVTDFLLRGVKDLRDEFPEDFVVQVNVTEDDHGSEKGRSGKERAGL